MNIICALEENVVRLRSDESPHGHKSKWADVEGLTRLREIAKLLKPSEGEVVDLHHASTHHLDLDTTALTEKEGADSVIRRNYAICFLRPSLTSYLKADQMKTI